MFTSLLRSPEHSGGSGTSAHTVERFRRLTVWLVVAGAAIAVGLALSWQVRVDPSGTASIDLLIAAFLLVSRIWWPRKEHKRLSDAFGVMALVLVGGMSCGAIAMLGLRLHLPLADGMLRSFDHALWVDGIVIVDALVRQGQWLFTILAFVYNFTIPVFFLGLAALAIRGDRLEAWRGAFCFVGTLLTTCLIAMLIPAKGLGVWAPAELIDRLPKRSMLNFWEHFDQFYSGADPVLRLEVVDGVVSFPSFHAIVGFLTFAMWRKNMLTAIPAAAWLGFLLLATFPYGGHYVVDLLGGLTVWAAWFAWSRRIERENIPSIALVAT